MFQFRFPKGERECVRWGYSAELRRHVSAHGLLSLLTWELASLNLQVTWVFTYQDSRSRWRMRASCRSCFGDHGFMAACWEPWTDHAACCHLSASCWVLPFLIVRNGGCAVLRPRHPRHFIQKKTDFKFKRFQRGTVQVPPSEGFQGGRWFKVQTTFYRIYRRGIYLITYIR